MEKGPIFTQSIIKDACFLKLKERIKENTKWWYSFDSKLIIYKDKDEIDKLTKFSYEQLFNFYEEKVKKLMPKNIKKSAEVLKQRYQLRIQINNLQDYFLEIMKKQQDLKKNEVKLREISKEIKDTEEEIKNKEQSINNNIADKNSKDKLIKEVNKKLEAEIKKYQNKKVTETVYSLEKTKCRNIYCNECHNNCHSPCDCAFDLFGRCVIYEFSGCFYHTNLCSKCGHIKATHGDGDLKYVKKTIEKTIFDAETIKKITERAEEDKEKYKNEINNINKDMNEISIENKTLYENKQVLEKISKEIEKSQKLLSEDIEKIDRDIIFTLFQLQKCIQIINSIALNNNYIKIQNDYIDSLKEKILEMGDNKNEQLNQIDEIKKQNDLLMKVENIKLEEVKDLDESLISNKISNYLNKNKRKDEINKFKEEKDNKKEEEKNVEKEENKDDKEEKNDEQKNKDEVEKEINNDNN